jgi:hypothetical protein
MAKGNEKQKVASCKTVIIETVAKHIKYEPNLKIFMGGC